MHTDSYLSKPLRVIDDLFVQSTALPDIEPSGERQLFESFLAHNENVCKIPLLTKSSIGRLAPNSLVRYRGLVQDIYEEEFYVGVYAKKDPVTGMVTKASSKYRDYLDSGSKGSNDLDGPDTQLMQRQAMLLGPIPGESEWAESYAGPVKFQTSTMSPTSMDVATNEPRSSKRAADSNLETVFTDDAAASSKSQADSPDANKPNKKSVTFDKSAIDKDDAQKMTEEQGPSCYYNDVMNPTDSCCCIVKVYDVEECDTQFHLNDMVEVVGVYSFDPDTREQPGEITGPQSMIDDFIDTELYWPSSVAPRLHAITYRKVGAGYPLLHTTVLKKGDEIERENDANSSQKVPGEITVERLEMNCGIFGKRVPGAVSQRSIGGMPQCRADVVYALSQQLCGDELAAEYVLLATLSRVMARVGGSMLVGTLPLVLGRPPMPTDGSMDGSSLKRTLSSFIPRCVHVECSVSNLNSNHFMPLKDYQMNRLLPSPLQVGAGTVVLLDESGLEEGVLNSRGLQSIHALQTVLTRQELPAKYGYCDVPMKLDISTILLSNSPAASTLLGDADSDPVRLPLEPAFSIERMLQGSDTELITATLTGPGRDLTQHEESQKLELSLWWCSLRVQSATLSQEVSIAAENDFVAARQKDSTVRQGDLSRWITLAKLLAVSHGHSEVQLSHWHYMRAMERERKNRIPPPAKATTQSVESIPIPQE